MPDQAIAGVRILAVDDDPDTCLAVATVLTSYGAEVRTAGSAASALAVLAEWKPHVLLLDIAMPDVDGYQLIERVRARHQEGDARLPAIALTAYARPADRDAALAAGFDMHVAKPIEPATLVQAVATIVASSRRAGA